MNQQVLLHWTLDSCCTMFTKWFNCAQKIIFHDSFAELEHILVQNFPCLLTVFLSLRDLIIAELK